MWLIGIPLGAFVGALSGFLFLLILRAGFLGEGIKQIGAILSELIALVSFALGGSWFANSGILREMLSGTKAGDVLSPYLLAFTVFFFVVVCVPFYRIIVRFGSEFAAHERTKTTEKEP
jgi:hypothetical protein